MSLEGMDVERAQSIARQLEDNAQALISIGGILGILTTELLFHWRGPASMTFEQQWTTCHQPALHAASSDLADMRARLAANIAEQERASATDGQGIRGTVSRLAKDAEHIHVGFDIHDEWLKKIAGNDLVTGRYKKTWTKWLRLNHDAPFWKYKSSPVLHALHDNEWVLKASRILERDDVKGVIRIADKAAIPLAVVVSAFDVVDISRNLRQRQYLHATGHVFDIVGTGLVLTPFPPAELVGAGIIAVRIIPWDKVWTAASDYMPAAMSLFSAETPARLSRKLEEIF